MYIEGSRCEALLGTGRRPWERRASSKLRNDIKAIRKYVYRQSSNMRFRTLIVYGFRDVAVSHSLRSGHH